LDFFSSKSKKKAFFSFFLSLKDAKKNQVCSFFFVAQPFVFCLHLESLFFSFFVRFSFSCFVCLFALMEEGIDAFQKRTRHVLRKKREDELVLPPPNEVQYDFVVKSVADVLAINSHVCFLCKQKLSSYLSPCVPFCANCWNPNDEEQRNQLYTPPEENPNEYLPEDNTIHEINVGYAEEYRVAVRQTPHRLVIVIEPESASTRLIYSKGRDGQVSVSTPVAQETVRHKIDLEQKKSRFGLPDPPSPILTPQAPSVKVKIEGATPKKRKAPPQKVPYTGPSPIPDVNERQDFSFFSDSLKSKKPRTDARF
jgi:hypothetical protein